MPLQYCSSKAYDFVRKIIQLPHAATICTWAASVDYESGYLTTVINLVCQLAEKKTSMRDVVLIVDAMSLHKITIYDRKSESFVRLLNYGTVIPEPETSETTDFVFFFDCWYDWSLETPHCLCASKKNVQHLFKVN